MSDFVTLAPTPLLSGTGRITSNLSRRLSSPRLLASRNGCAVLHCVPALRVRRSSAWRIGRHRVARCDPHNGEPR